MAFVPNDQLPPNEQNQNAPTGVTSPNPLAQLPPSTGGSVGQGGSGATVGPNTATPSHFGTPASNLQAYLQANAPQIQSTADTLAGNLDTQYGQVTGDISNAATGFQNDVNAGYTPFNQSTVDAATSNPTQFASDPNNVSSFRSLLNDKYTGPANFETTAPYANVNNEVTNAVQNAGLTGTQAGLSTYLKNSTSGSYTPGMSTLDSLLLSSNPDATAKISASAAPFAALPKNLSNVVGAADALVPTARQAATDAASKTGAAFNGPQGVVPTFANSINTGSSKAEADRQAYNDYVNNFYSTATPIQQRISQWAGTSPGNPTVNDLITPQLGSPVVSPVTAANFATPDQYAEAQALQALAGGNLNLPIDNSTAGMAGTAPTVPTGRADIQSLLAQYAPELLSAVNSSADSLTPLSTTNPGLYTSESKNLNDSFSSLAKYLSQFDPANYHAVSGDPNTYWGYA